MKTKSYGYNRPLFDEIVPFILILLTAYASSNVFISVPVLLLGLAFLIQPSKSFQGPITKKILKTFTSWGRRQYEYIFELNGKTKIIVTQQVYAALQLNDLVDGKYKLIGKTLVCLSAKDSGRKIDGLYPIAVRNVYFWYTLAVRIRR